MKRARVKGLLYQALETEKAAIDIYAAALRCAQAKELKMEWTAALQVAKENKKALRKVLEKLDLDPKKKTSSSRVVAHLGESLVSAIRMARKGGDKESAEGVATECVVFIESKHEFNWGLMEEMVGESSGDEAEALKGVTASANGIGEGSNGNGDDDEDDHHAAKTSVVGADEEGDDDADDDLLSKDGPPRRVAKKAARPRTSAASADKRASGGSKSSKKKKGRSARKTEVKPASVTISSAARKTQSKPKPKAKKTKAAKASTPSTNNAAGPAVGADA